MVNTAFEREQKELKKAKESADNYKQAELKQKEAGYKWWLINDRGITARKWSNVKPINAI